MALRSGRVGEAMAMNVGEVEVFRSSDVVYLDAELMDGDGRMRLLPAEFYHALPKNHLRAWASIRGRYCIPTIELVDWLNAEIGGRTALEIGAGCGDLGFHLGILMTDSYQQIRDPATVLLIMAMGQAPTRPPPDVFAETAEAAVWTRRPQVVVGAWITEKFLGNHEAGGNEHGPREENILAGCETYIMIGNTRVHGRKRILARPHAVHRFPWLVSRAADPAANAIYLWQK